MANTILCPIAHHARQQPQAAALKWGRRVVTWSALDRYVDATARELKKIGLNKGERAAFVSFNSVEMAVAMWAMWRSGIVACPVSPRWPGARVREALQKLKTAVVLCGQNESVPGHRSFAIKDVIQSDAREDFYHTERDSVMDLDADALVIWTSGSSGQPKAVLLSYGNLYANASAASGMIPFSYGDTWLLSLPLFHVAGAAVLMRSLMGGGAVRVPEDDDGGVGLAGDVTHVSLVPTQLKRLLEETADAPEHLKAVLLGGSSMPKGLIEEACRRGWPVFVSYGMTETASQIATGPADETGAWSARVLPEREVKIDEGEICVRGPIVFKGYIQGSMLQKPFDGDGWFATGDTGVVNGDALTVTGRKDRMMISGGENIHPEEIEQRLMNIEGIAKAVVVPVEDAEFGQRPVAVIRWQGDMWNEDALRQVLGADLPSFKIPVRFFSWPEIIPREGKPDYHRVELWVKKVNLNEGSV